MGPTWWRRWAATTPTSIPPGWRRRSTRSKPVATPCLGPAADGGYYLIALRREALHPSLFERIAWSAPSVFAATLSRLRARGLDPALLPEAHDLDTVAELARFRDRLERRAELRSFCPRTAEVLL